MMATLHMIEGPVGAGKTTFANDLGRKLQSPPLILDAWFVTLFVGDKPDQGLWDWYAARKKRCVDQMTDVAQGLIENGHDAIVELGLIQRSARFEYYMRLEAFQIPYVVHVLDAPQHERLARVRQRNTEKGVTFAMTVSDDAFATASKLWEPPDATERKGRDIRIA